MLDYNQIKDLIKEIDSSSLRVFELEDSDIKLKLSKNDENKPTNDLINDVSLSEPSLQSSNKTTFELNTTEVNDEATTLDENITIIKSPLVGTYYSSSKPGGDSYVTVGSNVKKGDLVFFDTNGSNNGDVSHVGIYMGDGKFIHASSSKGEVVISDFNSSYYKGAFVNARRVL